MNDSFEFTLHNPLTEEDWNKISDAELEHTNFVTFQTSQGRQVRYIKCDVLDKIRAEIKQTAIDYDKFDDYRRMRGLWIALEIIDKYQEKSEE
jgi:hypothetical protein